MLTRALTLACLLLTVTFAGCLGGDEAPPQVAPQDTNDTDNVLDANDSTTAPDGRGDLSAFKETNKTETGVGAMEHTHDYWQGRERIDVSWINAGLIPFPVWPCREGRADSGGDCYNPGTSIADFDIPSEHGLVYEGTKQVILTATRLTGPVECAEGVCTPDTPPTTELNFDFITAADDPSEWRPGGTLALNQPVVIDIKPTEADMPHQLKSLWLFRVYTTDATWINFNITITIVRGYDVVDWPPHPDLYADNTMRLIYDDTFTADSRGTADSFVYGSDSQWFRPEKLLSWGTDRIEITVSDVTITTQVPGAEPTGYLLEYHNASKPPLLGHGTQYGGRLADEGSDGVTFQYAIDIAADDQWAYDTPYAAQSRWGFRFVPNFDVAGSACVDDAFLQQLLVGCQVVPWTITYHLKIVAYGQSTGEGAMMPM